MFDASKLARETQRTLDRLLPRLEQEFAPAHPGAVPGAVSSADWDAFRLRLQLHFPTLFPLLLELYGDQYDFFYQVERILALAATSWLERPAELKALDVQREIQPAWFQSEKMLGGVCYVDLFAGGLQDLRRRIPYFQELGLTYLHLMPLFDAPKGDSDGGYAVSDYRTVDDRLGTMDELKALAADLRAAGISLVLDFIFNHTSDEHRWAKAALAGDPDHREYYFIFPDRTIPDAYERTLREIFPDKHPGAFTYRAEIGMWVWTTFNIFQWDLNYRNPMVFREMAGEMLYLANAGAEVLRLDALAFTWKEMGTVCESLPQAHTLVQAFNALLRIAAPSLLFKSEAIVHPDEVAKYISEDECRLSYNPLLMALLWNSLATREVRMLQRSMSYRFQHRPRMRLGQLRALSTTISAGPLTTPMRRRWGSTAMITVVFSTPSTRAGSRAPLPAGCPSKRTRARVTPASPAPWPRWPGWKAPCAAATRPKSSWPYVASASCTPSFSASAAFP